MTEGRASVASGIGIAAVLALIAGCSLLGGSSSGASVRTSPDAEYETQPSASAVQVTEADAPRSEAADSIGGEPADDAADGGDLRVERGPGLLPLIIPHAEDLAFEVEIDLGALGEPTVGRVALTSGTDPYIEGLPTKGDKGKKHGKEAGWLRSTAEGSHLGYSLNHELYVRHVPQLMPSVLLTDTQRGSESRQRRLKIGLKDGELTAIYEHDGHCKGCSNPEHFIESTWMWGKPHHCDKCKRMEHRVWKEPLSRAVPAGTLDMLSAVYLARTMVRQGEDAATFPLIDKQKLWSVALTRGRRKVITVPAGRFDCVEVRLKTSLPAGEPNDGEGFQGLFGIQGTIQIWLEASTGVPVLIAGTLPVPVLGDLDVRVELKRAHGTPSGFKPLE